MYIQWDIIGYVCTVGHHCGNRVCMYSIGTGYICTVGHHCGNRVYMYSGTSLWEKGMYVQWDIIQGMYVQYGNRVCTCSIGIGYSRTSLWEQGMYVQYGNRVCMYSMGTGYVCTVWEQGMYVQYGNRVCMYSMGTGYVCTVWEQGMYVQWDDVMRIVWALFTEEVSDIISGFTRLTCM